jgi:NAD(P)H-flavin reductase
LINIEKVLNGYIVSGTVKGKSVRYIATSEEDMLAIVKSITEANLQMIEENEEDQCLVCGEPATRYKTSFPICSNPVCYEVRLEEMKEVVNQLNKKAKGGFE